MIDTSWSKLIDTPVGVEILSAMDGDPRLKYHNGDHVRRMYARAKMWRLPYDVTLDGSILGHDCVYDEHPDKELRSATRMQELYREHADVFHAFGDFSIKDCNEQIISTIGHRVIPEIDSRLLKLDLAELGDDEQRWINFWNIFEESQQLYGISNPLAAQGTIDFMKSFLLTMNENAVTDYASNDFVGDGDRYWSGVVRGVEDTLLMAQVIVNLYEQGYAHELGTTLQDRES